MEILDCRGQQCPQPVVQTRKLMLAQPASVLKVLVDEKVKFELTSPDVIHSFWIPAFLMKMDVVPGRNNQFAVTPNTEGEFVGKCAELCGVDHSRMLFDVKVVSRAEYDAHIADLRERGQVGKIDSGRSEVAGVS